jgi:hypothetical protein
MARKTPAVTPAFVFGQWSSKNHLLSTYAVSLPLTTD